MDRGGLWAIVHGVTKSRTRLNNCQTHTQISIMHLYTVFIMLYTQCTEDYKLENFTSAPFQTGGSSAYFVNLRASLLMSGAWHEATLELWKL